MLGNVLPVALVLTTFVLLLSLSVVNGLQCYNCRGITNYDPNECFEPTERTIVQECLKNEVCEKRVTMVDRLQDVIDRGCSANCAGRDFIWTDEYQVYCCNDKNMCNTASRPGLITVIIATVATIISAMILTIVG